MKTVPIMINPTRRQSNLSKKFDMTFLTINGILGGNNFLVNEINKQKAITENVVNKYRFLEEKQKKEQISKIYL